MKKTLKLFFCHLHRIKNGILVLKLGRHVKNHVSHNILGNFQFIDTNHKKINAYLDLEIGS